MVLMHLGRAAAAAPDLRAAYDAHPTAQLALSVGYAYQAAHQPGPAIVFLQRALTDAHTLPPVQRQQASAALGYAYADTEQHDKATGCFEAALGILTTSNLWRSCGLRYETAALP
jgi:tetratricopeptide (TPR) repeat protein